MPRTSVRQSSNKYAAKLLFQYRFSDDKPDSYRMVEERIVVAIATSSANAYRFFRGVGRENESKFKNDDDQLIFVEFVGIIEMIHLGIECSDNEVWYDIKRMKSPMERRALLVPNKSDLSAFRYEDKIKAGRKMRSVNGRVSKRK